MGGGGWTGGIGAGAGTGATGGAGTNAARTGISSCLSEREGPWDSGLVRADCKGFPLLCQRCEGSLLSLAASRFPGRETWETAHTGQQGQD